MHTPTLSPQNTARRRTKIVATLGPATDSVETLSQIIEAGVDVVRLNFSHGKADEHRQRAARVRSVATNLGRDVAILGDLQGPKIRIEGFANGPIVLTRGQRFTLDTQMDYHAGHQHAVAISYPQLVQDVRPGDTLLLNDGAISLIVDSISTTAVHCVVELGGKLSDKKGINRKGGGLSAAALTEKDFADIILAAEIGVDYLAVSFPRSGDDMRQARDLLRGAGGTGFLMAKIERAEAITNMEEIVMASDAVMVARGDLGVEIGDEELPGVQKRLIAMARDCNKLVITATQMMESMITNPIPTRAEVLDVANAVMDGSDAVMLSAETAAGDFPVKAVEAMARVCVGAERQQTVERRSRNFAKHFERIDETIALAAIYTARHMNAKAIVALTESGATALLMSRTHSNIPIYALTRHETTRRRMALCRGVFPVEFSPSVLDGLAPIAEALACLQKTGAVEHGDRVLLTCGENIGPGGTNSLKVVTVGEWQPPM